MKILVVYSNNSKISPFVSDQIKSLKQFGIKIFQFGIIGNGIKGYLKNFPRLKKVIKQNDIDLIHAHYSLSGLFANLQRKIPVITTYHGSDVNDKNVKKYSLIASKLSKYNIIVLKSHKDILGLKKNYSLLPCGVNLNIFSNKHTPRENAILENEKKLVLFSSSFDNKVKNFLLANQFLRYLNNQNIEIIELKGYSRHEVSVLLNKVDVALLTSFSEGSPQFIKEAMACNCPIVSTDVGDVREVIGNTKGCYITSYDPKDVRDKIKLALKFGKRTNGRQRIIELGLDSDTLTQKIINIYKEVLEQNK